MQIYQDIWINGTVKTKGIRDCEGRYLPIQTHCSKYHRPITILDIGANLGYFSFRLSYEFDCTSVMIEGDEGYQKALLDLIEQQKCKNKLTLLGTRLDISNLQELSKCEHFDVVLALRVVHHFQESFCKVIDAISSLGDFVFFELPTAGEDAVRAENRVKRELVDHSKVLSRYKYNKVGEFPIHVGSTMSPMYLVENTAEKVITRPFYGSPRQIQHSIESTFNTKKLLKQDPLQRGSLVNKWVQGINLYTYNFLNGLFPDRREVANRIKKYPLPNGTTTDIRPWNFILNGDRITLIDHTSINTSLGQPFRDNPRYCLFNTALYIHAGIQSLKEMSYNQKPFTTKKWLLCCMIREMGKDILKISYSLIVRLIDTVDIVLF